MIRHILAAVMISVTAASAQASWPWWAPSPWTVAITVGEWITKKDREVYYLQVRAQGHNEEDARQQAFRLAVNQAIGTLVLAETEAHNGEIIRNEIISHSSGYVEDFRVLTRHTTGRGLEIVIDVWVTKSVIADRILNRSQDRARIEGGRIGQQIDSFNHSRGTGDQILTTVLRDFPVRSFDIQVGHTRVIVDQQRQPFLVIPVTMSWNATYLASLAEAAEKISHRPDCNAWLMRASALCQNKTKVLVGTRGGYFDDEHVGEIVMRQMWADPPRLLITIKDTQNQSVYRVCWGVHRIHPGDHAHNFYEINARWGLVINERAGDQLDIAVALNQLPVQNLDRVDAEMIRHSRCPN